MYMKRKGSLLSLLSLGMAGDDANDDDDDDARAWMAVMA